MTPERVPFHVYKNKQWNLIGYVDKAVSDYLEEIETKRIQISELMAETRLDDPVTFDEALEKARVAAARHRRKP